MKNKAFPVQPDSDIFFESPIHKGAVNFLKSGIAKEEAFLLVLGKYGMGKTLLGFRLADYLAQQGETYITVPTPVVSYTKLLKKILESLECPPDSEDLDALQNLLLTNLGSRNISTDRITVIIDEIQDYDVPTLIKIRMLSNYNIGGTYPFHFVFLGHPSFLNTLEHHRLEALDQRIRRRYVLEPFSEEQTKEYIYFRLLQAGAEGTPYFPDESIHLIHKSSGGVPRVINNICDSALLLGAYHKLDVIGAETVREAVSSVDHVRTPPEDAHEEKPPQPDRSIKDSNNVSSPPSKNQTEHSSSEASSHGRRIEAPYDGPFGNDSRDESTEKIELFPMPAYRYVKNALVIVLLLVGSLLLGLEVKNRWGDLSRLIDGEERNVDDGEEQDSDQVRDAKQAPETTNPLPSKHGSPGNNTAEDDQRSTDFELSDILAEQRPNRDDTEKNPPDTNEAESDGAGLQDNVDHMAVDIQNNDEWQTRYYPYSLYITIYNTERKVLDALQDMRNEGIRDLRVREITHGSRTIGWALYQGFYETREKARQARRELGLDDAVVYITASTSSNDIAVQKPETTNTSNTDRNGSSH
ncbi:MAG: ExeA family protein [Planctomycetota bacterium]